MCTYPANGHLEFKACLLQPVNIGNKIALLRRKVGPWESKQGMEEQSVEV